MLRCGIALLALVAFVAAANEAGYKGFQLFEVIPKTQQQSDFLHELSKLDELYDFFALRRLPNQPAHVMVHRNEIKNFLHKLAKNNLTFKILDADVGNSVTKAFERNMLRRKLKRVVKKGRLSTDRFYNHAQINKYIERLAREYPSRVTVNTLGKSYLGRDLKTITITNGDGRANKSAILIDAGIHAREWISPATALYVIEQLVANYKKNAKLLENNDFIILPVVNPDGYEYSQEKPETRYWRKSRQTYPNTTCIGSDMNRNFGFHWNVTGSSPYPCEDSYAGPYAYSEPETEILRDLMDSLKHRGIFYLTLHAYGNLLLYPWGWTTVLPDDVGELYEVANVGSDAIYYATGVDYLAGNIPELLYPTSGGSHDYAYHAGFKISIAMELSGYGGGYVAFAPDPSDIDSMVKEAWIGIRAMCQETIKRYSKNYAQ